MVTGELAPAIVLFRRLDCVPRFTHVNGGSQPTMDQILTLEEVADLLQGQRRAHGSSLYRLLRTNGIPAFKVSGEWRFDREAIENWLRKEESAGASSKTSR
jgi:excisionase family DNA binding protein